MSMMINTNQNSLTAQNNASKNQNALTTAITRLSSGLRINSAADDAAGLAISDRMTAQVNGLNQAARNANDGISLAQTADGALSSVSDDLQRIRELAVQSVNSTNSASDRASMQLEVAQLQSEIDRVATQTQFNGTNLLDGSFTAKVFQVGANAGQTITVAGISSARASDLGASYVASKQSTVALAGNALAATDLTLNGATIQASVDGPNAGQDKTSAYAIAQAINASQGTVLATANATSVTGAAATTFNSVTTLTINGVAVGATVAGTDAVTQGTNVAAAINQVSAASGVTATVDNTTGKVTLAASDGRNIVVAGGVVADDGLTVQTSYGKITLSTSSTSAAGGNIVIGGTTPGHSGFASGTVAAALTGTAVSSIDISSVAGANAALASIDAALATIDSTRASLGAIQNRFSSTVQNVQNSAQNVSASRSRIQDADFAAETANLSRAQVLQQAGTAMVAQANQMPQQVLKLLQ